MVAGAAARRGLAISVAGWHASGRPHAAAATSAPTAQTSAAHPAALTRAVAGCSITGKDADRGSSHARARLSARGDAVDADDDQRGAADAEGRQRLAENEGGEEDGEDEAQPVEARDGRGLAEL